jgi:hypothetical protein
MDVKSEMNELEDLASEGWAGAKKKARGSFIRAWLKPGSG